MYSCVCKAVSSKIVEKMLYHEGLSIREVCEKLGVGHGCGRCLEAVLAKYDTQQHVTSSLKSAPRGSGRSSR